MQIADVLADPDYSFGAQAIIGYRALLGVPVVLDDELIGVVSVGRNVPGAFSDQEIELVQTFADQAAIAIANARLLDTVERQRTELSRFLSPQVAELISSERGEQLLAGHRAYITCLFSDLRGFTSFAETAAPEELFEVLRPYHEPIGGSSRIRERSAFAGDGSWSSQRPVAIDDHEPRRSASACGAGAVRVAGATWASATRTRTRIGRSGYATVGRSASMGSTTTRRRSVTNLSSRQHHAAAGQTLVGPRSSRLSGGGPHETVGGLA